LTTAVILGATFLRLILAAAIVLFCLMTGLAVLPPRWRRGSAWHDLPLALSVGVTTVGTILWIAAATVGTRAVAPVVVLLLVLALRRAPAALRMTSRVARRVIALARRHWITALLLTAVLACLVPQLCLPPMASDAVRYHLAGPRLALLTGRLAFDPYNLTSAFPQTAEMLYLLTVAVGCGAAAKAIQAIFFALDLGLLVLLVHRGRRLRRAALLAPLLFAASPVALAPAAAAFIDHIALFHVAVAALLLTRRGRPVPVGLALAGALATKWTAAPAVAALALVALVQAPRRRRLRALVALAVPAVIVISPYAVRNTLHTGDPIYPVGHVLLGKAIPGVPPASVRYATQFHGAVASPLGIGWSASLWPVQADEAAGLHHLLLGFVALLVTVRVRWARPLLAPVLAFIAVNLVYHLPARYLLPMFWSLAAVEAIALERWLRRLAIPAGAAAALPAGIAAAGVVLRTFSPLPYLAGRIGREALLAARVPGYAAARAAGPMISGGRIMALDFPAPYYLDHPWIAEGMLEEPPLKRWLDRGMTAPAIVARLRREDVRLLLVTPGYGGGTLASLLPLASTPAEQAQVLELRRRLRLVRTVRGVDIWAVPPAGVPPVAGDRE